MRNHVVHDPKALNMGDVYLQALTELARPAPAIPLLGWPAWTRLTGGFRVREFTIFCGPTGAGKTTFLANLSAQLLQERVKHFVMSVETGHTDFMKRILSVFAGKDLNTGEAVSVEVLERLNAQYAKYLHSGLIEFSLYEDRVPIEQLKADLIHMVNVKGCRVAMVDNMNFFMEVTRAADAVVEMDRVIHELIILCKQIDMHLIMVMHPKKNQGAGTRVESEYDIKGSSTAVQEAHNVFLFNRPKPGERTPHHRELRLAKMRRRGVNVGCEVIFKCEGTRYVEEGFA